MSTPTTTRRRAPRPGADRPAAVVQVPRFQAAEDLPGPPAEEDMPLIEERTTGTPLRNRPAFGESSAPYAGVGSPGTTRTRTDDSSETLTSSTTKAETARNAGVLLAGILSMATGAAAVLLLRAGRALRRPTKDENRAIARPLARILVRHIPADMITADLADLGEAGAAIEEYVSAGPLAPRIAPVRHVGMPDHTPPAAGGFDENPAPTTPAAPDAAQIWQSGADLTALQPSALAPDQPMEVSYQQ